MPSSRADGERVAAPGGSQQSEPGSFRAKLVASLSAVALVAVGAVFTPLGTKVANLIWPDPPAASPTDGAPAPAVPSGTAVAANEGCKPGGPALSVALSYDYDFKGSTWWATAGALPDSTLDALNAPGEPDPSAVLAKLKPVQSLYHAGTLLKLVATGCSAKPVVIVNMSAKVTKRAKPLDGGLAWFIPQGDLDITTIGFDLDTPKPFAETYESREDKLGGAYFQAHATQITAGETVPFSIMGLTKRSYIEWSIALETLVDGHPWNLGY